MDVGPARQPRSPLVFPVGPEPHFPRLERFPTTWVPIPPHLYYLERSLFKVIIILVSV